MASVLVLVHTIDGTSIHIVQSGTQIDVIELYTTAEGDSHWIMVLMASLIGSQ